LWGSAPALVLGAEWAASSAAAVMLISPVAASRFSLSKEKSDDAYLRARRIRIRNG
jgi:hypothetical protein